MSLMQKKKVDGFPYLVTDQGELWSLVGRNRKPRAFPLRMRCSDRRINRKKRKARYIIVTLVNEWGLEWRVALHRVVAEAFIPNPLALPEVDHIDHDTHNNKAGNLRWVTHRENCNNRR